MLIAGVVGMLSFLTNALSITTQRFLSFHQGANQLEKQKQIFSTSLIIHVILGVAVLIILEIIGLFLFDGWLLIPSDRISAAKYIFHFVVLMVLAMLIAAPFRAALIAHENLIYISVIDIVDGVLKVVVAFIITNATLDKLILYAILMASIYIFALICLATYDFIKYKECVFPSLKYNDRTTVRQLGSFAAWSLYSSGCIVARNQGTAITINHFFGTIINASYGIAIQVFGAISFISSSILTAFTPQIVKSAGKGDLNRMLALSRTASKLSFALMIMVATPLCFRITDLLSIWLDEIPPETPTLCIIVIITTVCDQITSGLISVNRAIGKLRRYSLIVDSTKLLTIPLLILSLSIDIPLRYAISCFAACELAGALLRLPVINKNVTVNISFWISDVLVKSAVPIAILTALYYFERYLDFNFTRFIASIIIFSSVYLLLYYFISCNANEKGQLKKLLTRKRQ